MSNLPYQPEQTGDSITQPGYVNPNPLGIQLYPAVQQGWQCPVCHGVMAPWMTHCAHCKPPKDPDNAE